MFKTSFNPELLRMAKEAAQKLAFQPPGGADPSGAMGGGMPMDPAAMMGGGMPPGAPPPGGGMPMDPAMMGGGAPGGGGMPMDPAMMGGAPPPADPLAAAGSAPVPGGGGLTADTIRQIMQETLGQVGVTPGQPGPGGGAAGGKPGKPDLQAMSMDIFQIKKMVTVILNGLGFQMPQSIIDGPNRDPATGQPTAPGAPGSTSDPVTDMQQQPQQPQSAIKPIGTMAPAMPMDGGGIKSGSIGNKAAALSAIIRQKKRQ